MGYGGGGGWENMAEKHGGDRRSMASTNSPSFPVYSVARAKRNRKEILFLADFLFFARATE